VFLAGHVETEPDVHDRLIRMVQGSSKDDKEQVISYRSVDVEQAIPEKKPPKEPTVAPEGLLKHNWAAKHFQSVPSCLIFTVPFSVDWPLSEWVRKEAWVQDRFNRLKTLAAARDLKIVVLVIRIGVGVPDKDTMDERLSSLRRHLQLDSRTFHLLTSANIADPSSAVAKKVSKYVREFSAQFYSNKTKQLKGLEKGVGERHRGLAESILLARYNFKIAFFYEFQGQVLQSLRYYRQCYVHLAGCVEVGSEKLIDQVKSVAETAHVKICNTLLLNNSLGEAFQQFKSHVSRYATLYQGFSFLHYAWMANQYVVFAELLEMFSVEGPPLPDADLSYYYQNAARYSKKQQAGYERARSRGTLAAAQVQH
jgi:hypothetical protein